MASSSCFVGLLKGEASFVKHRKFRDKRLTKVRQMAGPKDVLTHLQNHSLLLFPTTFYWAAQKMSWFDLKAMEGKHNGVVITGCFFIVSCVSSVQSHVHCYIKLMLEMLKTNFFFYDADFKHKTKIVYLK